MNYHFPQNYDDIISRSDAAARDANIASNDAFVLAMARAVKRGREKAEPGTFKDDSAPIRALRIRGDVHMSACGSPAAMCVETGARGDGAQTLR